MITEKETIRCEAVFNEERTHRVLWKRVWNKDKPLTPSIRSQWVLEPYEEETDPSPEE